MATSKKEVATKAPEAPQQNAVVGVPDYIKQGLGRGTENVAMHDVLIPRVEVVQALSPCLKKNDPSYIEGAQQGDLYNTVTRELYGPSATLCPVYFNTQYLIWKDRQAGGGFRGAFDTNEQAQARIAQEPDAEDFQAVETKQFVCLRLDDATGNIEEVMVSMARTKLKVARQWNSLIRINASSTGADMFSRIYTLFTVDAKSDKGDFKNFAVQSIGFAPVEVYRKAEALYSAIAGGERKATADYADAPIEGEAPAPRDF